MARLIFFIYLIEVGNQNNTITGFATSLQAKGLDIIILIPMRIFDVVTELQFAVMEPVKPTSNMAILYPICAKHSSIKNMMKAVKYLLKVFHWSFGRLQEDLRKHILVDLC